MFPNTGNLLPFKRLCSRNVVGIAEAATQAYADEGVLLIRSMNVTENGLNTQDWLYIDRTLADKNRSRYLRFGDILTVRTGNAGISAVLPQELVGSQCFTLLVSSPHPENSSHYYAEYLNSTPAKHYFALESWGTAQLNISVPILQNLPCPVPPPDEQRQIADEINSQKAERNRQISFAARGIALLREYRAALISAAVTGQLDIRKHENRIEALA